MTKFYFDVWASDDLNGTALGELTQAYGRTWQRLDQAIGSGQFTINRHDSQYTGGWCAQDNLVRVRLVAGGPFAADDARYVHAFFIEEGDDEAVSTDEEGGEEITRGGRDAVVILRRAIVNFESDFGGTGSNDAQYWAKALIDGNVHFTNKNAGTVLRVMLRNATARTPNPLDPMIEDFNSAHDTAGNAWAASDEDWNIPIGQDLLEVLGTLASGDIYWRMGTDFVLHAWDDDPGTDVSGSVAFVAGDNIRDAAQRQVHARETISRALVQGTKKNGGLTYRWVASSGTETALGGRREGFVEYQATPTASRLDKAGLRAIRSRKKQHDGPTTLGVEERAGDPIAFTDYAPGDSVTVDIPGVWDSVAAKVYGVQMDEDDAGDALVTVILEEQPFDPASGATSDAGLGDGTGSSKCGDCPPLPPHVPGEETCTSEGTKAAFGGTWSWDIPAPFASIHYQPTDSPTLTADLQPAVVGEPQVGASGYPSPGSSIWWYLKVDRGASPSPAAISQFHITVQWGYHGIGYGPTLEASHDGSSWTQIVDRTAWDASETTPDVFELSIPSGWRSARYLRIRSDDLFVSGFWLGYSYDDVYLVECVDPIADTPPLEGQAHTEQLTGDGSTTAFQTNYPYAPNSVVGHVTVNGVLWPVTETDPTTGTFAFDTAPPLGAVIVVSYQNAGTTGTGATNPIPPASTPAIGGGASSLPWFDVTDPTYGAVGNGTTDDTTAIQAAIDAAAAAGGGVVYFPLGLYKIAGALQDTGRSNAQLLLPRIDTTAEQITIHLLGEAAPPAIPYISGASVDPNNGPILVSTLGSGTGALLGSWGPSGSFADFSLVRVVIEDLVFRMPADPTNSCVDLSHVETVELRGNVMIDAGEYTMGSISQQTTSTSYGLKLPGNNNGASTYLPGVVNVVGFYNGILAGEHTIAANVQVWACRKAYVFPAVYHASHFDRMAYYHCQRGLVFTGSKHYLTVSQLDVEHAASGTWVQVYDLDDASNYGYGHLAYHVVLESTGYDSTWTVNGATNLHTIEIGSNPYGGSFATPAIVLGTAAAAGAASTVMRSDSTIVAFDATVPVTQAFSDTAATGSAAVAARRDHRHGMPATPGSSGSDHEHVANVVFSGDASTTVWELPVGAVDATSLAVYVAGLRSIAWALSGPLLTTLTFDSAPASAANNIVVDIVAAIS